MKKITFLSTFLLLLAWGSYGQCIRTTLYPFGTTASSNLGIVQTIVTNAYTKEYSVITNIAVGEDYEFTCVHFEDETQAYITVTDVNNVVIAHGPSPLTVEAVAYSTIRVHFSDNAACASTDESHITTIRALLDCVPPNTFTVSDITTSNATFEWEAGADETAWEVLVLAADADFPTSGTAGIAVTGGNPMYTTTLLNPAGNYRFYVRANCEGSFSPWNGPLNFVSGCNAVDSFSEDFESFDYDTIAMCWGEIITGANNSSSARVLNYSGLEDSNSVGLFNRSSDEDANTILVAPKVSNLSAGTHRLKFNAKSDSSTLNLQFGTVDNTNADATFTELENLNITNQYDEYSIDYTVYEGTDTFIAIRHNGSAYNYAYLDNIRWEVAPACMDVSGITFPTESITAAEALVVWEANGSETQWDVVYGPTSVTDPSTLDPITPSPTGTPEAALSGLIDNTTYKVWVRSVCGEGLGAWVGPKTFKTLCVPTATLEENFDAYTNYNDVPDCWSTVINNGAIYASASLNPWEGNSPSSCFQLSNGESPTSANTMLVSPEMLNIATGTYRVKFFAKGYGVGSSLQVGTVDTNTNDAYFTEVMTLPLTSEYAQYVVEFTDTNTSDVFIAFRHDTNEQYSNIYIDDVVWEPIPLCPDVTQIAVQSTTTTEANITWEPGGGETEWDVVYGLSTVTDPSTLEPITPAPTLNPETTITGLTDNTNYKLWVRSVCGDDDGLWIGPIAFKTQCVATATIDEDFDTTTLGTLPDCWTALMTGAGVSQYADIEVNNYNYASEFRSVVMQNDNSANTANIMLIAPPVSNIATGDYRVKFFARSGANTGSLQVGTVDIVSSDAVFTEIETISLTDTHMEYAVNFASTPDTNIAFRLNTPGTYSSIFIDDVRWELAPLCADVANVQISEITTESAFVTWESQGNETKWQLAYGTADVTDPATLEPSAELNGQELELEGLSNNVQYKVWVRSVCGDPNGNGAWIGPISFYTKCLPASVPYVLDFENASVPSLPNCTDTETVGNSNTWDTININDYGFNSNALHYLYNSQYTADTWFYTQGISLTAGTEYKISYKYGSNSTEYAEKMKVMYGTDATADAMTEEIAVHEPFNNNVAITNEVPFMPATSGVYYFGFHAYSGPNQYYIYVDDISIDVALGNGGVVASDFSFYPNPVKDVLNLSYDQNISDVAVFNLLGQQVITKSINAASTQIDMSGLAAGSYLVKVTSENQTKTIKVIKQ